MYRGKISIILCIDGNKSIIPCTNGNKSIIPCINDNQSIIPCIDNRISIFRTTLYLFKNSITTCIYGNRLFHVLMAKYSTQYTYGNTSINLYIYYKKSIIPCSDDKNLVKMFIILFVRNRTIMFSIVQ